MRIRLSYFVYLLALVLVSACGIDTQSTRMNGVAPYCHVEGRDYQVGETFTLDCNTCRCTTDSRGNATAQCTLMGCSLY